MKILFPLIKTRPGGVDIYIQRLKRGLKKENINLEVKYYPHVLNYFPPAIKLFKNELSRSHDLVHTNLEFGVLFKDRTKPLICTAQSLQAIINPRELTYTNTVQKIYYRTILRKYTEKSLISANRIVCVSEFCRNVIMKEFKPKKSIDVIYNGIDTDKFKPLNLENNNEKIKLLFVGNLIKRKGIDLLLKIMEVLDERCFELRIIGGLDTSIEVHTSLKNIKIIPKQSEDQLVKEYNSCDIFVFPSRSETFGYPVAEAMSCGKPVIATNACSFPELINDNKGGFLCEMDNICDFVDKIKMLAENSILRKKMGKYNRMRAIRVFDIKKCTQNYARIYNDVL